MKRVISKDEAKAWDRFTKQAKRLNGQVDKVVERLVEPRGMVGGNKPRSFKPAWWASQITL